MPVNQVCSPEKEKALSRKVFLQDVFSIIADIAPPNPGLLYFRYIRGRKMLPWQCISTNTGFRMTDFRDIMRSRTNSELVKITTLLRAEYQPEAVVAADEELSERGLSAEEHAALVAEWQRKQAEQEEDDEQSETVSNWFRRVNPLTGDKTGASSRILLIGVIIVYVLYLLQNGETAIGLLQDITGAGIGMLEYLLPFVLFPVGIYGLWKMKKYGWVLLTVLLAYYTVTLLSIMLLDLQGISPPVNPGSPLQLEMVENPFSFGLQGNERWGVYIGTWLLLAGLLVLINRKRITDIYGISRPTQMWAMGMAALPLLLLWMKIWM